MTDTPNRAMADRMRALAGFIERHADEALPLARLASETGLSVDKSMLTIAATDYAEAMSNAKAIGVQHGDVKQRWQVAAELRAIQVGGCGGWVHRWVGALGGRADGRRKGRWVGWVHGVRSLLTSSSCS